jgi:hypothetical protein
MLFKIIVAVIFSFHDLVQYLSLILAFSFNHFLDLMVSFARIRCRRNTRHLLIIYFNSFIACLLLRPKAFPRSNRN